MDLPTLAVEHIAQPLQAAAEEPGHRGFGLAELGRDIRHRRILQVAQLHGAALVFGQLAQGGGELQ